MLLTLNYVSCKIKRFKVSHICQIIKKHPPEPNIPSYPPTSSHIPVHLHISFDHYLTFWLLPMMVKLATDRAMCFSCRKYIIFKQMSLSRMFLVFIKLEKCIYILHNHFAYIVYNIHMSVITLQTRPVLDMHARKRQVNNLQEGRYICIFW